MSLLSLWSICVSGSFCFSLFLEAIEMCSESWVQDLCLEYRTGFWKHHSEYTHVCMGGRRRTGANIGQDRTRCKIWNQQVILFLEFVMAPASFFLSLPQKLSHWKGAMRSQKVVSYLTCWLSFPPCSPRYAPLNHSVLCYFLPSHFLLLSNSFLFLDSLVLLRLSG